MHTVALPFLAILTGEIWEIDFIGLRSGNLIISGLIISSESMLLLFALLAVKELTDLSFISYPLGIDAVIGYSKCYTFREC
jgi:hypothetical protein